MSINVYKKIEYVLKTAGVSLAVHEFDFIFPMPGELGPGHEINGREYVGCSEATLGRRLRELRELGRVTAKRRDGKSFVEYALAAKAPVEQPPCPI